MATTSQTKKTIELAYLERFRSLYGAFPSGRVESTEEPDFLVHGEKSIVGMELTELHHETQGGNRPMQANEAMRQRVVARAQSLYEASGNPPVIVSIFFSQHNEIQKADVEELATAISSLAINNLPELGGSYEERYDWVNREYFPEEIDILRVRRIPQIDKSFFSSPGATWVATLSKTDIDRALQLKENKVSVYRQRCAEAWLVINTDLGSMSTWFEFDSPALTETFVTSFNRVFVVRHFAKQVFELRTSQ